MSLASGITRLDTNNRRSIAVSDVERLSGLSKHIPSNDGPYTQELDGVILRRIPMVRQSGGNTSTSYEYVIENKRQQDVKILLTFGGVNFKVAPVSHLVKKPSNEAAEGILEKGASITFVVVEPVDPTRNFSYDADIKIFPVHNNIRESVLDGVKLFTTITYSGLIANMFFESYNTKDIDVEVELNLKGAIKDRSSALPFKVLVPKGKKVAIGHVTSDSEVESIWKWQSLASQQENLRDANVQTSELKGVTLKQTMSPGDPTLIQFDIINGRSKKIHVEIDVIGEGEIDFKTQARPLTGTVLPGNTNFIGAVTLRGHADVSWKFKELD